MDDPSSLNKAMEKLGVKISTTKALNMVQITNTEIIENLGLIDLCICDKTGTLTKNELTLVKIYTDNKIFNLQPVKDKKTDEIRFSSKSVTLIREHLDSNEARNA